MVMVPSRPVTALVVLVIGCVVIAVIYTASGRSGSARAEQLSDVLEHSLNSSAIAREAPGQPVAFCNATGDCAGNRQHFSCRVDRADSRWGYEVALQPAEDTKLGTTFAKDFACGMAHELSVAAFEGIMLMMLLVSIPIVLYRRRGAQPLLPL